MLAYIVSRESLELAATGAVEADSRLDKLMGLCAKRTKQECTL